MEVLMEARGNCRMFLTATMQHQPFLTLFCISQNGKKTNHIFARETLGTDPLADHPAFIASRLLKNHSPVHEALPSATPTLPEAVKEDP